MEYWAVFFGIVVVVYIFITLIQLLCGGYQAEYGQNEEYANIYHTEHYRYYTRLTYHNQGSELICHSFNKTADGKWKYDPDYSDLKKRIILFTSIILIAVFTYCMIGYLSFGFVEWPGAIYIVGTLLVAAVISFLVCSLALGSHIYI